MNFKLPSAQSILLIIAAFVALLTWLIPAGTYNTLVYNSNENRFEITSANTVKTIPATQKQLDSLGISIPIKTFKNGSITKPISIPNSYENVEANPQGVFEFLKSPIQGIIAAADIIFLVLIIGGLIQIMTTTGAFDAGISWLAKALKGKEFILIILTTFLTAIGGTTFGFAEETLAFYPILLPIFLAARYDAMVCLATVFMGAAVGVMCSTINPFSTIIASDAAGVNWTTGLTGRIIMFVLCVTITILYILRYAKRVKANPKKSLVYGLNNDYNFNKIEGNEQKLTLKFKLILTIFGACFLVMIIGVSQLGWWFIEMTTTFLVGAVLIGIIARLNESQFISSFLKGASDLLGVAFIIGIARGVSLLMDNGLISDTVLFNASNLTQGLNKGVFINVLFLVYNGLTFFIPSTSGMAVLTMPILSPLADAIGIGKEHIVSAFQYGTGLFNAITPTGLILASLGILKIGYDKWLRFVFPLIIILALTAMVVLTVSVY